MMNIHKQHLIFVPTLIIVFFVALFIQQNVFAQTPIQVCGHDTIFDPLQKKSVLDTVYLDQSVNETDRYLLSRGCNYDATTTPSIKAKIYINPSATEPINLVSKAASRLIFSEFICDTINPLYLYNCLEGHHIEYPNGYGIQASFNISKAGLSVANEDKVIDKIAKDGLMSVVVESDVSAPKTYNIPATNCVKLSGNGPKKIVFMRNNVSSLNGVSDFISKANDIINNAFAKTDPWKTYFDKLSFYVDLKTQFVNGSSSAVDINKISSCGGVTPLLYLIFGDGAGSGFDGHVSEIPKYSLEPNYLELAMHESGHAVGNLWDESQCGVTLGLAKFQHKSISETDCTKTNSNFTYNNIWYGGKDIGYDELEDNNKDVRAHWFIPNLKNLMRYPPDNTKYYNVISCGFLMSAIVDQPVGDSGWTNVDWEHAQKYWPECMKMDTVKEGIPAVNPTPTIRATPP